MATATKADARASASPSQDIHEIIFRNLQAFHQLRPMDDFTMRSLNVDSFKKRNPLAFRVALHYLLRIYFPENEIFRSIILTERTTEKKFQKEATAVYNDLLSKKGPSNYLRPLRPIFWSGAGSEIPQFLLNLCSVMAVKILEDEEADHGLLKFPTCEASFLHKINQKYKIELEKKKTEYHLLCNAGEQVLRDKTDELLELRKEKAALVPNQDGELFPVLMEYDFNGLCNALNEVRDSAVKELETISPDLEVLVNEIEKCANLIKLGSDESLVLDGTVISEEPVNLEELFKAVLVVVKNLSVKMKNIDPVKVHLEIDHLKNLERAALELIKTLEEAEPEFIKIREKQRRELESFEASKGEGKTTEVDSILLEMSAEMKDCCRDLQELINFNRCPQNFVNPNLLDSLSIPTIPSINEDNYPELFLGEDVEKWRARRKEERDVVNAAESSQIDISLEQVSEGMNEKDPPMSPQNKEDAASQPLPSLSNIRERYKRYKEKAERSSK